MVAKPGTGDAERLEALRRLLVGLAAGQDVFELSAVIADLHPEGDTFPGEVYLRLGADVLELHVAAGGAPITVEGLRERHLEEIRFRGSANRKIKTALLSAAAMAGGLEPDLADEIYWWGRVDDFWRYGLYTAVGIIRASASNRDIAVAQVVAELAEHHEVPLPEH